MEKLSLEEKGKVKVSVYENSLINGDEDLWYACISAGNMFI